MFIIDSLKYCQKNKGLQIVAYCIMDNHIHIICQALHDIGLSDIIRDLKSYTARGILNKLKSTAVGKDRAILEIFKNEALERCKKKQRYIVWQRGYRAIEVSSNTFLDQKIEYIHINPVKAGIVSKEED